MFEVKEKSLFLAPMAGFTNSACRQIFKEYGADVVVSEFVYCKAITCAVERVGQKLSFDESQRPVGLQIFGSDEFEMLDAAEYLQEHFKPDFIDVNFGCPAPNATEAGAGSALLKNPSQMKKIVKKLTDNIKNTPISAKLRLGWDCNSIIVPDVCLALQDVGASFLTLHGRTKTQGYSSQANWLLIEKTAQSLDIPLVGNGSVELLTADFLRNSACKAFMIGRSALGNPWIFQQIKAKIEGKDFSEPTPKERLDLTLRFAELLANGDYSKIDKDNIKYAKTQIMRFVKGVRGFKNLRLEIQKINTINELKSALEGFDYEKF